jgi:hypothetical protein
MDKFGSIVKEVGLVAYWGHYMRVAAQAVVCIIAVFKNLVFIIDNKSRIESKY